MKKGRRDTITMTNIEPAAGDREPEQRGRLSPYDYQWRAFIAWCHERHVDVTLPVPARIVADYLSQRLAAGVSHSTLRVMAAAITYHHRAKGLPNPCEDPAVGSVLAASERRRRPVGPRSRPLDLEAYRAIRRTAQERRPSRAGVRESWWNAQERGRTDVAMIGLMRDGMLRVSTASTLRWGAIERQDDGTGRLTISEGDDVTTRTLSADTMRRLDAIRDDAPDDERVLGLMPNQISARIGAAAEQAGLGTGYSGESPRLGMLKDLEELGAVLLGERIEDRGFPDGAGV